MSQAPANSQSKRSLEFPPVESAESLLHQKKLCTGTNTNARAGASTESSTAVPSFTLRSLSIFDRRRTNDEIHSTIDLDPVTNILLDTPQLQRLRGLKQLGAAEYVYINTNHCRLEHSLGVAHLAERMCLHLNKNQPNLGVTEKDVLCVKIAGLFHDAGHGPFSHAYEEFVKRALPDYIGQHPSLQELYANVPDIPVDYCHERTSSTMMDAALLQLGLRINLDRLDAPLKQVGNGVDARSMKVFNHDTTTSNTCTTVTSDDDAQQHAVILTSRDFVFIKECIWGKPIPEINQHVKQKGWIGRPHPHHEWLYDIVANRHSGLDVDKIDYFARDQRRAFRESGEIDKIILEEAVVAKAQCTLGPSECWRCKVDGKRGMHLMICYPEKLVVNTMEFFNRRLDLHSKIYQHKTVASATILICDILCRADPFFRIHRAVMDTDTETAMHHNLPVSRAMLDASIFLQCRDSVIDMIANTVTPELAPARALIVRLRTHDLYKCVIDKPMSETPAHQQLWNNWSERNIVEQMLAHGGRHGDASLHLDDLVVQKCTIHCGRGDTNPLSHVCFLEKSRAAKEKLLLTPEHLPQAVIVDEFAYEAKIPRSFQQKRLRLYCRDSSKVDLARHVFASWLAAAFEEISCTPEAEPARLPRESCNDDLDEFADRHRSGSSVSVTPLSRMLDK
jgi:HD superfamily phosphohydrolase